MSFVQKQNARLPNLQDGVSLIPTPVAGVGMSLASPMIKRARFKLDGLVVSMLAANDFGSQKICDLPTSNISVFGAVLDASFVVAGCAVNAGTSVLAAVGTAATASTALTGAGENNVVKVFTCAGATSAGLAQRTSGEDAIADLLLGRGAKAIYLNCSSAVTSGTGTITISSGILDLYYVDLGDHS